MSISPQGADSTNAVHTNTPTSSIQVTPSSPTSSSVFLLAVGWLASASGVYVSGVSMTGTTGWTKLWSQQCGSSNPWVVAEIWIGYANGTPSGSITVTFSSNVTAPIVDCQKLTGISSSSPLENAY